MRHHLQPFMSKPWAKGIKVLQNNSLDYFFREDPPSLKNISTVGAGVESITREILRGYSHNQVLLAYVTDGPVFCVGPPARHGRGLLPAP